MDSIIITARDGQSYRMSVDIGEDGFYYLNFTPLNKYNTHKESIRCNGMMEAVSKFEKNRLFYKGF